MKSKSVWQILKGTFKEFSEDNVLRLSAALAYYSIFSIGPLLIITVGVAALVLDESVVRTQVKDYLQSTLGSQSSGLLDTMMKNRTQGGGLLPTIIGIVTLLFGASGVFGQLQDALNTIWEVKSKPGGGILLFLRKRFLSFGMVLVIGFLLLVSMLLSTAVSAMSGGLGSFIPMSEAVAHALTFILSFGVVTLLFALIFKVLPDVKIRWRDVWVGAIFTAFLFTVGKFLLGLYLGRESTTSAFGAAGAIVLVLLWVYYASIILFLGAEFTQVYAKAKGHRVVPSEHAVPVTEAERANQGIPRQEPKSSGNKGQISQPRPVVAPTPASAATAQVAAESPVATIPSARTPVPFRPIQEHPWRFASIALSVGMAFGALHKSGVLKILRRIQKATS